MDLPRGWYQVAGVTPHTFRRHGLATASGSLQLSMLPPPDEPVPDGDAAMAMLHETLVQMSIAVGSPLESGHEEAAGGWLAHATYRHVGGQREYWIIPGEVATVFAAWQMGAKATAGMERHDIHEMLKRLHFEEEADAEDDASAGEPVAAEADGQASADEEP